MSPTQSWAASGARRAAASRPRAARAPGSWALAVARAREAWDDLTGGPAVDIGPDTSRLAPGAVADPATLPRDMRYSDAAAAAILAAALGLWADTAAAMDDDGA